MLRAQAALRVLAIAAGLGTFAGSAGASEFPFDRYAQEARALMALAIAVQELAGCGAPLEFREEAVAESNGTLVKAIVSCPSLPARDGTSKPAKVTIELGIDENKVPIGPTSFDYDLP